MNQLHQLVSQLTPATPPEILPMFSEEWCFSMFQLVTIPFSELNYHQFISNLDTFSLNILSSLQRSHFLNFNRPNHFRKLPQNRMGKTGRNFRGQQIRIECKSLKTRKLEKKPLQMSKDKHLRGIRFTNFSQQIQN